MLRHFSSFHHALPSPSLILIWLSAHVCKPYAAVRRRVQYRTFGPSAISSSVVHPSRHVPCFFVHLISVFRHACASSLQLRASALTVRSYMCHAFSFTSFPSSARMRFLASAARPELIVRSSASGLPRWARRNLPHMFPFIPIHYQTRVPLVGHRVFVQKDGWHSGKAAMRSNRTMGRTPVIVANLGKNRTVENCARLSRLVSPGDK